MLKSGGGAKRPFCLPAFLTGGGGIWVPCLPHSAATAIRSMGSPGGEGSLRAKGMLAPDYLPLEGHSPDIFPCDRHCSYFTSSPGSFP